MTLPTSQGLSPRRRELCSREHALRVAARIFDEGERSVSLIRTGSPLQPYRISTRPAKDDTVELQMVS